MPPEPPPVPIDMAWLIFPVRGRVTFDRPLTPAVLDPTNWSARVLGLRYKFASVAASGVFVRLDDPDAGLPDPGPTQVTYLPPPFDLISTFDKPAAAFTFEL